MGRLSFAIACTMVAAAGAGCGAPGPTPLSEECTASVPRVIAALHRAPAAVTLRDGSKLSSCISDGLDDAELQNVGIVVHQVAEELRARAARDPHAAVELGYLVGAVRRGARHTAGIMAELQRRVELVAGGLEDGAPPAVAQGVERGLRAGEATG